MPNRKAHITGGVVLIIITYYFLEWINLSGSLSYAITIFLGAIIPDILEPAKHWTHRKFFHSQKALIFLLKVFAITFIIGLIPFIRFFWYVSFFALGYIGHLGMDATTPMGLPK